MLLIYPTIDIPFPYNFIVCLDLLCRDFLKKDAREEKQLVWFSSCLGSVINSMWPE